ncbi:MAG TPA: methionyl-tRNA formyltransferase [Gemmatimonadaceae bacterium]|nr:methionyl-tRNA formyltransferase [Gemmatimonadaceae bacterium]
MRVLFWGTPEFAVPPLRALIGEGFDVVGVVTQPDKPVGRSRSERVAPPVKQVAAAEGIPVLQPERPRGDEFLAQLRNLAPDISAVVAYGHILPQAAIDLPPHGTLNIHASLLPLLRGAAPVQAAIREGFEQTGVSIMRMVPALDAGPVLLRAHAEIYEDETAGELALRLSEMGAAALIEALALIDVGAAVEEPQDDARATYAPKIDREMTRINWRAPADVVSRTIRAYDPKPGALASLEGADVKCFGARRSTEAAGAAGEVLAIDDDGMTVACGTGAVRIAAVHPAGKQRMAPAQWARGRGVAVGARFSLPPGA